MAVYLPRVIRLATACEDFADLRGIIEALQRLCQQVQEQCDVVVKAWPEGEDRPNAAEMLGRWKGPLFAGIRESIAAAFPPRLSKAGKQAWQTYMADCHPAIDLNVFLAWPLSVKGFQTQQARLFSLDLAHLPFRFIGLPKEMVAQRGVPAKRPL